MNTRKIHSCHRSRVGLTLMEVLVSLILVSTVLLVSITASANLLRNSHMASSGILADQLASQILDEISTKNFRDTDSNVIFGLEPDESITNRTTFDDVDDYHNYVNSPPTQRDGTAINGFSGWSYTVSVQPVIVDGDSVANSANSNAPLRLVTVTCTSPASEVTSRSMLLSNVPNDADTTVAYEKWRRVTFTFTDGLDVTVTAPMLNRPEVTSN